MTDLSADPVAPTAGADPEAREPGQDGLPTLDRWSDRLNPILVREVQQALNGRSFLIALLVAALAIICVGLAILFWDGADPSLGRDAFSLTLSFLAPIIVFVVPLQAFLNTRQEVAGGTAEQLALTRMTPTRIVTGKLGAAMVQFSLFLAMFAPVLALTFLLRSVDVVIIAILLVGATFSCLAATMVSIALGCLGRVKMLAIPLTIVCAQALAGATVGCIAVAWEGVPELQFLLHDPEFWLVIGGLSLGFVLGIVLLAMVATSALSHRYENRSTQFRLFAVVGFVLGAVFIGFAAPTSALPEVAPMYAAAAAAFLLPFWWFAVCEDRTMSPRVAVHVPERPWLAAIAIPFLPGGGRGLMFTVVLAVIALAVGGLLAPIAGGVAPEEWALGSCAIAWGYTLVYATLVGWVRSRFRSGWRGMAIGMASLPLLLFAFSLLPGIIEAIITLNEPFRRWGPQHALNPFFALDRFDRSGRQFVPILVLYIGVGSLLLFNIRRLVGDVGEVVRASAARRERAG